MSQEYTNWWPAALQGGTRDLLLVYLSNTAFKSGRTQVPQTQWIILCQPAAFALLKGSCLSVFQRTRPDFPQDNDEQMLAVYRSCL